MWSARLYRTFPHATCCLAAAIVSRGSLESLDELATVDAALAELVNLKFFCGFSFLEIAGMRSVSERTVQRDWEKARIYLYQSIRTQLN